MTRDEAKKELVRIEAQLLKMAEQSPANPAEFNKLRFEYDKVELRRLILLKVLERPEIAE